MIRRCTLQDLDAMDAIINAAAQKYRGVIPPDRWQEPYMPREELQSEIAAGVRFWGYCHSGEGRNPGSALLGVMGLQDVRDVTLIRHAYVLPHMQGNGIGSALMRHLVPQARAPLLVGTWAGATWAIAFYERHGFRLASPAEKDRLLDAYWTIPARQRDTSVVLVHGPKT
jgi:GNAT superfamily N-acetyltransferase